MSQPEIDEAFAELRREDAKKAPPFARMWRPREKRVSIFWVAAPAVSCAAAAAALVIWVAVDARRADAPAPVAAVPAPSVRVAMEPDPLAFLLEQPSIASMPDLDRDPRHP